MVRPVFLGQQRIRNFSVSGFLAFLLHSQGRLGFRYRIFGESTLRNRLRRS